MLHTGLAKLFNYKLLVEEFEAIVVALVNKHTTLGVLVL